jgi:fucose 4-O-acetylase-like acetyltransferase
MTQLVQADQSAGLSRDLRFDILKVIGLLCIILAHTEPPEYIAQIRNFDVPLMVVVSGALFYYTSRNRDYVLIDYLRKRVPRLILPVWCFLVIFFISTYLVDWLLLEDYSLSFTTFLSGLFLVGEIKYFWIIRVFILIAIASPILLKLYRALGDWKRFLAVLGFIYLSYEGVLVLLGDIEVPLLGTLANEKFLLYAIPYGCLYGLGMVLPNLSRRSAIAILAFFFSLFLCLFVVYSLRSGEIIYTQGYKYPPRLFYLSYGIFMCMLLNLLVSEVKLATNLFTDFIVFVSQSSLWIYLWHTCFLYYWKTASSQLPQLGDYFVLTFLVITALSISITYVQKQAISAFINTTSPGQKYAKTLTMMFLR